MEYLREIGPDTMVPCFSLNLKGNTDVNLLNKIVEVLYKDLSMSDDRVSSYRFPMIVTSSTYTHHYHSIALKQFKKRLGVRYYTYVMHCVVELNEARRGNVTSKDIPSFLALLKSPSNVIVVHQ